MEKDEITVEQINNYRQKTCKDCDFFETSFCDSSNDDVRDCIIIDIPLED